MTRFVPAGPAALLVLSLLAACATAPAVDLAPSLGIDPAEMERTPSGLLVRTDREGEGLPAREGDTVVVHYTGWLADGTQFDASRDRGRPLVAELGPGGRLVPGWDEGMRGMRVGERRTLVIPPALAYGAAGAGDVIPPDAWLVFEVELLELR